MSTFNDRPTREQVKNARLAAGLDQGEAATLAGLRSSQRWSEYERGDRNIEASRFELFLIKTNQHPDFGPRFFNDAGSAKSSKREEASSRGAMQGLPPALAAHLSPL